MTQEHTIKAINVYQCSKNRFLKELVDEEGKVYGYTQPEMYYDIDMDPISDLEDKEVIIDGVAIYCSHLRIEHDNTCALTKELAHDGKEYYSTCEGRDCIYKEIQRKRNGR